MGISLSKRTFVASFIGTSLIIGGITATMGGAATSTSSTNAAGDTFVSKSYKNKNNGALKELRVDSRRNLRTAYVKFVVPSFSGTLSDATLKLHVLSAKPSTFAVYKTTDFNETTVTYNNAPAVGDLIANGSNDGTGAVSINVTSAIRSGSPVAFAVVGKGTQINFASREAGVATAPKLVVTSQTQSTTAPTTAPAPTIATTTTTKAPTPSTTTPPATAPVTTPPTTAPPTTTGFPNASNTGVKAGISLARHDGNLRTTRNGQVIQNLEVYGTIEVCHHDVVIRNVKVLPTGHGIVTGASSELQIGCGLRPERTLIEDVEIDGSRINPANKNTPIGILNSNFTARRVHIHGLRVSATQTRGFGTGIHPWGNAAVEDSYLHTFGVDPSWNSGPVDSWVHREAIHVEHGSNVTLRHNTLLMDQEIGTTAGIWTSYGVAHHNIVIEKNLVGSKGGFAIGCGGSSLSSAMVCRDNAITTMFQPNGGYWGPFSQAAGTLFTGNYWYDGPNAGKPIN